MNVLGLDIGGTKVHGAVVAPDGKILRERKEPVRLNQGPADFINQLGELIVTLRGRDPISKVGIGCAGPLDSVAGTLLDPTNFFTDGKSWGKVPLVEPLAARLKELGLRDLKISLDNDAAAAVLGEAWLGQWESQNLVVLTLGTGVGVGVLVDGKLQRLRQNLHPEASHIPLNFIDESSPCGCGLNGCVEAYLSGVNFTQRLQREWDDPTLSGEKLFALGAARDLRALQAFRRYGEWLAQTIQAYAVLFGPRAVILGGGFARNAPYFLPVVQERLPELLRRRRDGIDLLPRVAVSRLGDALGVLGAACVAK